MAARRFTNLKIIDINDLKDLNTTVLSNTVLASVPEQIQTSINTYDLVEAIQNQHQIPLQVQHVSYYGPGYFLRLPTLAAKAHLLRHGFVYVHNFIVTFVPWKPDYGSTIVPLRDILTSVPFNLHLARDKRLSDPYERLSIQVSGTPPQLYCASTVYKLFDNLCTINKIHFIPAELNFDITAHGQLSVIPNTAHIGLRGLNGQSEIVHIWPLTYETLTDQMRGRDTPPEDRVSELRGNYTYHTNTMMHLYRTSTKL